MAQEVSCEALNLFLSSPNEVKNLQCLTEPLALLKSGKEADIACSPATLHLCIWTQKMISVKRFLDSVEIDALDLIFSGSHIEKSRYLQYESSSNPWDAHVFYERPNIEDNVESSAAQTGSNASYSYIQKIRSLKGGPWTFGLFKKSKTVRAETEGSLKIKLKLKRIFPTNLNETALCLCPIFPHSIFPALVHTGPMRNIFAVLYEDCEELNFYYMQLTCSKLCMKKSYPVKIPISDLKEKFKNFWRICSVILDEKLEKFSLVLWNKFSTKIGLMDGDTRDWTLKWKGWINLSAPTSMDCSFISVPEDASQSDAQQMSLITSVQSFFPCMASAHSPFMQRLNLVVLWANNDYHCYTLRMDSVTPSLTLMRNYSLHSSTKLGSQKVSENWSLIVLNSSLVLESVWDVSHSRLLCAIRHVYDDILFHQRQNDLRLYLDSPTSYSFPTCIDSISTHLSENQLSLYFTVKKQIYNICLNGIDQIDTARLLQGYETKPTCNYELSIQKSIYDQYSVPENYSIKKLFQEKNQTVLKALINLGLLPITTKNLQKIISLELHDVLRHLVKSPLVLENNIATMLSSEEFSSTDLCIIIQSLDIPRNSIVSVLQRSLTTKQHINLLMILFQWFFLIYEVPPIFRKKQFPSLTKICDFIGILLDSKFNELIDVADEKFLKKLIRFQQILAAFLECRRNLQKIHGQMYSFLQLNSDSIQFGRAPIMEETVFRLIRTVEYPSEIEQCS